MRKMKTCSETALRNAKRHHYCITLHFVWTTIVPLNCRNAPVGFAFSVGGAPHSLSILELLSLHAHHLSLRSPGGSSAVGFYTSTLSTTPSANTPSVTDGESLPPKFGRR